MLLYKLSWFYNFIIFAISNMEYNWRRKNIIKYHHLFEFKINKLQIAKGAKDITNTRFLNMSNVAYPS
jgi:hypothetical protein